MGGPSFATSTAGFHADLFELVPARLGCIERPRGVDVFDCGRPGPDFVLFVEPVGTFTVRLLLPDGAEQEQMQLGG